MCFLLLLGLNKGTYGKKSKNLEREKIVPTNPDLFSLLGWSKESCKRNQRIQKERKRLTPHPIYTMPILMHWNLSFTFFPFVLVSVLAASKTIDLLKENSGNKKFWPGNHKFFQRKLWEHEILTNGPGPVGLNAELRNHRSFKRKLWEQEIPTRNPQIF